MNKPNRIPLRPDYSAARRTPPGQSFVRAVLAVGRTRGHYADPAAAVKSSWPDDRAAFALLTKSDAVPGDITSGTWGSTLSGTAVGEFISSLGPMSAAAKLIGAGQRLTLGRDQKVNLPKRTTAPSGTVGWVAPAAPIGVRQGALNSVALGPPKKLAAMLVATSEALAYSDAEQVLGQLLREDIAATLDASLFDDTAADTTRPAGLLAGLSPLTASTATATRDKMVEDFANLAGAITDAGGSGENLVFICSPRQAMFARLNLLTNDPVTIWPSTGLADGDIIAIQSDAFCSAFGSQPDISLSRDASLVFTDPAGALVAATGGVSVIADPAFSLWQQDLVGIRVILDAAWCLRAPLIATVAATWAKTPA